MKWIEIKDAIYLLVFGFFFSFSMMLGGDMIKSSVFRNQVIGIFAFITGIVCLINLIVIIMDLYRRD